MWLVCYDSVVNSQETVEFIWNSDITPAVSYDEICTRLAGKVWNTENMNHQGSDALGTGQYFRNKLPINQLANWRQDYYPKLETDLTVGCIITNSGDVSEN